MRLHHYQKYETSYRLLTYEMEDYTFVDYYLNEMNLIFNVVRCIGWNQRKVSTYLANKNKYVEILYELHLFIAGRKSWKGYFHPFHPSVRPSHLCLSPKDKAVCVVWRTFCSQRHTVWYFGVFRFIPFQINLYTRFDCKTSTCSCFTRESF